MKFIKYVPLALLLLCVLKSLALGTSFSEVCVMAVLAAHAAFLEKSQEEAFKKDILEKLETHKKGFENVDSFIKKLFENDKELSTAIQKVQLPQTIKNQGFGRM